MSQTTTSPTPPRRFAELLNHLFATRLSPSGRPYTLREVSDGTGGKLSIGYLSLLRKGRIEMPSGDRIQALADFFGVDLGYFLGRVTVPDMLDEELRMALEKPLVRDVALRASAVGEIERALILQMLERAQQLVDSVKARAALEDKATSTNGSGE